MSNGLFKKTALALCIGSLLSGCIESSPDGDNKEPSPSPEENRVSITGFAVKGILAGAIVEAYDITGTELLGSTFTDEDGKYTLPGLEHNGPVLIKLKTSADTLATCDSATGCGEGISFGAKYDFNDVNFSLSAVLPSAAAAAEQELMVTPVTHMAAERALTSGATTREDINTINLATASLLGLDGVDINTITPIDITDPQATKDASPEQQLYSALVASIQTIAEADPEQSIADVVNNLAEDFAEDGGLVSNSESDNKITLEEIFNGAGQVVVAVEQAASDAGINLDLDSAETSLTMAENEAGNAEADEEVIIDPEPEPEPGLTKAEAAQQGIDLLVDLNAWQDALQADNQSLVQPFENQIEGAEVLLESVADQSKVLQDFYSLVGQQYTISECGYADIDGNCYYYDEYNEFETGPLLDVVGIAASLMQLADYLQAGNPEVTEFNYSDQIMADEGINIQTLTEVISEEDAIQYDLIANYTRQESKIDSITFTLAHQTLLASDQRNFAFTFTQNDFNNASTEIAFEITSGEFNLPEDALTFDFTAGEAVMSFASAAERIAFSNFEGELDPSVSAIAGLKVQLQVVSEQTESIGEEDVITSGSLGLVFDYEKSEENATSSRLSLSASVGNDLDEIIAGTLVVNANTNFEESDNEVDGFVALLDLVDADAVFTGNVSLASDDGLKTSSFNGSVTAQVDFFLIDHDAELDVDTNPEIIGEQGRAEFEGTVVIADSVGDLTFDGKVTAHMEGVKAPDGTPFQLKNGAQYHLNKLELFGRLSANQFADGTYAAIEVNGVVTADIAGVEFTKPASVKRGDVLSSLKFGMAAESNDHARFYINFSDLIPDTEAKLVGLGYEDVSTYTWRDMVDFNANYNAINCEVVGEGTARLCDVTESFQGKKTSYMDADLSEEEKETEIASNYPPTHDEDGVFNKLETHIDLTGSEFDIISECVSYIDEVSGAEMDNCSVQATYTGSADMPAEIQGDDRIAYLRGLDNQLVYLNRNYSASCAPSVDTQLCDVNVEYLTDTHLPIGLSDQDKLTTIIGENTHLNRSYSNYSCELLENGNSLCTYNYSSTAFTTYLAQGALLSDEDYIAAAMENTYVIDYFEQQQTGDISLINCTEYGGDSKECEVVLAPIEISLEVPASFVQYYGEDSFYADHRYYRGTYAVTDHQFELLDCSLGRCNYTKTTTQSGEYSAGLLEEQVAFIAQGSRYSHYNYQIAECAENACIVTLTSQGSLRIPGILTEDERALYIAKLAQSSVVSDDAYSLKTCRSYDYMAENLEYCEFDVSYHRTHLAQLLPLEGGLTQYAAEAATNSNYLPSVEAWLNIEHKLGYLDASTGYDHGGFALSGEVEEYEIDMVVRYNDEYFFSYDFQTEDAYIELSAALSVKAELTGLENSEISVFVDRIGHEDVEGSIKFINGLRTIDLSFSSLLGFDDEAGTNLVISNENVEMSIFATCAGLENDFDEQDTSLITGCDGDFNFKGEVFVADFKVADLEDRDGLPVFNFDTGSSYDLILTPNFIVQPSAQ